MAHSGYSQRRWPRSSSTCPPALIRARDLTEASWRNGRGNEREARTVASGVGGILPCVGRFGGRTRSCHTGALDLPRGEDGGRLVPRPVGRWGSRPGGGGV